MFYMPLCISIETYMCIYKSQQVNTHLDNHLLVLSQLFCSWTGYLCWQMPPFGLLCSYPPKLIRVSRRPKVMPKANNFVELPSGNWHSCWKGSGNHLGILLFPFWIFLIWSAFLLVCLAICSILDLEAAMPSVCATFGTSDLSRSIGFATFWCSNF